jgi:hypothetical protein
MRIFGADTAGVEINLGWDLWGLQGNTLDISDMSVFSTTIHHTSGSRDMSTISHWWQTLPTWKQRAYGPRIIQTLTYQQYRSYQPYEILSRGWSSWSQSSNHTLS